MMKPCIAHLNQVMLFFSSFLIPSLLFLLLRAVLMNHSFDIVRLEKKMYLFHADLKASGYSVSNKVKTNAKEKEKKILKAVTVNTTF